jgi:peroxiredoxin
LIGLLAAASISLTTQANAQPRIGEKMPEFELQATDGAFYGSKRANGKVSVYFFVGYN